MKVYDPKHNQNFDFSDKLYPTKFSSLKQEFFVLDAAEGVPWGENLDFLEVCINSTSELGFFIVSPWAPGDSQLVKSLRKEFPSLVEFEGTICCYFGSISHSLSVLFNLRSEFGGSHSGEWGIGGCSRIFEMPIRKSLMTGQLWNFSHIVHQSDRLGCLLYLGQETTFLCRLYSELDEQIFKRKFY